ncbi:serine hydrolase domain-containing protein [Brevibacillus porteri]|uniref:Alkaline D-peptidase n=1 Tax=Brevibacillus porteri TaxID=2126350 RepID=A0ABX5FKY7_9BACL|nr:serine hydrolase domain-containing protein [Brevibacillus porteri]MED1799898.1 serine hydrolase [Brevibacillus porteri]MED2132922.1 serine hydrolase [Brevibacillus porteri]MED2744165.1 serine hydrolase [Brevibacillus porteri]MED2816795.1 serine hydrolase [Brevibacillus porteri]MED2894369.1 serine hydrolase [Brevibacillus porteri]
MKPFHMQKGASLTLSALLIGTLILPTYGCAEASVDQAITQQQNTDHAKIKEAIDKAAASENIPGVLFAVKKGNDFWSYASGEANIESKKPMEADYSFRIGSITKSFVGVVALQLAGEKKLSLDDSVEKWLPGVVHGNGYDGNKITIRQLLNHTSGVTDYLDGELKESLLSNSTQTLTVEQLISRALKHKPTTGGYSNTNTVLMKLIIQKVTGETYAEQIQKRIIEPLQLKNTLLPGGSTSLPEKSPNGYFNNAGTLMDMTDLNPSFADAAGGMISTAQDLTTFFSALLGGKLLPPEMQKEMVTTVDTPHGKFGLGIQEVILPNGTTIWGHQGGIPGFTNFAGGTKDGEHVIAMSINVLEGAVPHMESIQMTEFSGQAKQPSTPDQAAQKHGEEVTHFIDEKAKSEEIPGIVAAGLRDGEYWSYAAGVANLDHKNPMEPDFTFRIGSVTKAFVATLVLQLAQEKKLNLEDSVEKWLPGVVKGNGYDGNKITIRQLLNQTSGIASYTSTDMRYATSFPQYTVNDLVRMGLAKPPVFQPGAGFDYSNTNTVLAGLVIQKVTGETYDVQMKKRILDPLQMTNTSFSGSNPKIPGQHATGYSMNRAGKLFDFTEYNPSWANAAGEMISTGKDLTTFFSALLGGKLLNDEMLKQMTTGVDSPFGKYGLGLYEVTLPNGKTYWGHGGGIHGFETLAGGTLGGKNILVTNINAVGQEPVIANQAMFEKEFSR